VPAVVVAAVVYGVWQLFGLHVNEPGRPATASEAEAYTGVPLPAEARNIGVAGYRQWVEFAQYVRFEAPADVCLKYAGAVAPGAVLQPADEDQLWLDARPIREGALTDFAWFDLSPTRTTSSAAAPCAANRRRCGSTEIAACSTSTRRTDAAPPPPPPWHGRLAHEPCTHGGGRYSAREAAPAQAVICRSTRLGRGAVALALFTST